MKIAICEDNIADIDLLSSFLLRYKASRSLDYGICTYQDGDSLIEAVQTDPDIRIIFMDILMAPVSGIETAKTIRMAGNDCSIIFTTGSVNYYAESYEIGAEHYLVKPLTYERVCKALERCQNILAAASRFVEFTFNRLSFWVRTNDVLYIEVLKNTCYIHADQDYPVVASLDYVLERFNDSRFIRCHRSYAVNLAHVKSYQKCQILLDDDTTVPLSRLNADLFKDAYRRYLLALLE